MKRTLILTLALLALAAVVTAVVKMRATKAPISDVDHAGGLAGSLDTWPEVPVKDVA